ncbi:hypothetical protein DL98DRAFT_98712 [Cadophora sp. DSE1049]|nr:hypothetical protein DL98DRAFT_98712 [Cadophora sp. DSE1049]
MAFLRTDQAINQGCISVLYFGFLCQAGYFPLLYFLLRCFFAHILFVRYGWEDIDGMIQMRCEAKRSSCYSQIHAFIVEGEQCSKFDARLSYLIEIF